MPVLRGLSNPDAENGGVAQLGERLNGIQEASGSIPLISTIQLKREDDVIVLPFLIIDTKLHIIANFRMRALHNSLCVTALQVIRFEEQGARVASTGSATKGARNME